MCDLNDSDGSDEIDFSWGAKIGRGGKNKELNFYESFTFDGVEYSLYDSVYLFQDGESKPYVGKLIKIFELPNKGKRVKVLWFFYPSEIKNYLGDISVEENELFLATGVGKGLTNVNPLDRRNWFKELPWEERLKEAHDQGKLVLLHNLFPGYTSSEIEDLIWHALGEKNCTAKVVQPTASSNRFSRQAFVIFKTREIAEKILRKLDKDCLMLPNGRPLVGSRGVVYFPGKNSSFSGHLVIDKLRHQMHRDLREAVSTSHSSQPNTLEYEMAIEWRLLQERADMWWKMLYKKQGEEMQKTKASLKSLGSS